MDGPNPLAVASSVVRVRFTVRPPDPKGSGDVDPTGFQPILTELGNRGVSALPELASDLVGVIEHHAARDPDECSRAGALAYWLNLYNAGALLLAAKVLDRNAASVLRIPGGFSTPFVTVAGETLSLDAIEHAKVRRFGDPRIHAGLVCGSISCPTLGPEPFRADRIDSQLDNQMRTFLASGGADFARGRLTLSRIFLWYGADFTRPKRMPTWLPARRARIAAALRRWMPDGADGVLGPEPVVEFQTYDWSVACTVR